MSRRGFGPRPGEHEAGQVTLPLGQEATVVQLIIFLFVIILIVIVAVRMFRGRDRD